MRLILASASPRRADLLREAGIDVEIQPANIDEDVEPGEAAGDLRPPGRRSQGPGHQRASTRPVRARGRHRRGRRRRDPRQAGDPEDAARMLRLLSGRSHQVITGVCLMQDGAAGGRDRGRDHRGRVCRRSRRLRSTGTWQRGANGQGRGLCHPGLASRFVTRIEGSYSNVVGLPMALVYRMCRKAGLLLS